MKRLLCRLLGHVEVPGRSLGPIVLPEAGLVHAWKVVPETEARGVGCSRCGRWIYDFPWVAVARDVTGREP